MKFVDLQTLNTSEMDDDFFKNAEDQLPDSVLSDTMSQYLRYCIKHSHNARRPLKKNVALVKGHAKKPHPQKGGGRARLGSTKSPQLRGGGKAHAPNGMLRSSMSANRKVRNYMYLFAIKSSYSKIYLYNNFDYDLKNNNFSYKNFKDFLGCQKASFICSPDSSFEFAKQIGNLKMVNLITLPKFTDFLKCDKLFINVDDFKKMLTNRLEMYNGGKHESSAA